MKKTKGVLFMKHRVVLTRGVLSEQKAPQSVKDLKVIAFHGKTISKLWAITCHMR